MSCSWTIHNENYFIVCKMHENVRVHICHVYIRDTQIYIYLCLAEAWK